MVSLKLQPLPPCPFLTQQLWPVPALLHAHQAWAWLCCPDSRIGRGTQMLFLVPLGMDSGTRPKVQAPEPP